MLNTLDSVPVYSRGVDGSDYMPGLIGLNNIKNTDYVNVVVQGQTCHRGIFALPLRPLPESFGVISRVRQPLPASRR